MYIVIGAVTNIFKFVVFILYISIIETTSLDFISSEFPWPNGVGGRACGRGSAELPGVPTAPLSGAPARRDGHRDVQEETVDIGIT